MRVSETLTARVSIAVCLTIAAAACSSSSSTVTSPTSARCPVELTLSPGTLDAAGGAGQIAIAVNRECTWDARSEAGWITLAAPTSGQGDGTLRFSAAANAQVASRRGAVVVNDQRIEIPQSAAACRFELSAAGGSVGASGGSLAVSVTSQASCRWSAVSESDWIRVDAGRDGDGSGVVQISVSPNAGPARQGAVLVGGVRYTVSQAAAGATGPPPTPQPLPPPGCVFNLTPDSASFGAAGGEAAISVQASDQSCPWTAAANVPWIGVGTAAGAGNGATQLTVAANPGAERAGVVIIAGVSVPVTQAAAPAPNCDFTVSPRSAEVAPGGGDGTITVRTGSASCSWSATSNASWITLTPRSGSGNGDIRYTVAANTGAARTGTVSAAGVVVTISQGAAPAPPSCEYDVSPRSESFDAEGGAGTVRVRTGNSCGWTAAASAPWISLASGSGTGDADLRYTVATNTGGARSGSITVRGVTVTISQAAAAAPPACEYDISPQNESFDADGGSGRVRIRASGSCGWTAASNAPWITVTSGSSGSGNGDVRYTVAPNPGGPRTGTLTVRNVTITIAQAAAPAGPPQCQFDAAPRSESFPGRGGGAEIRVSSSAPACAWSATTNVSWISLASGGGSGQGELRYSVSANTGAARSGTIIVAGVGIAISQEAAAAESVELRGEISGFGGRCPNVSFVLEGRQVRTNGATEFDRDCDWLRDGRDATVNGVVQPDGAVLATRVRRGGRDD